MLLMNAQTSISRVTVSRAWVTADTGCTQQVMSGQRAGASTLPGLPPAQRSAGQKEGRDVQGAPRTDS